MRALLLGCLACVAVAGEPDLDPAMRRRIDDATPEARRRWPREVAAYLLERALNDPEVHAYRTDLLALDKEAAARIDADSGPLRFRFVRFRGELESLRENEDGDDRVWRGDVRTPDGVRVVFVTRQVPTWTDPNGPEPVPEMRFLEDGWVRGRGILVQNYIEDEGVRGPSVLVVATGLERDYATVPVRTLEDVPFDLVRDDPGLAGTADGRKVLSKQYPRALYRLVKYAEARAGGAGAERRAAEGLAPRPPEWDDLLRDPAAHRAAYCGGQGAIAVESKGYGPESIEPNDAGVESCVTGWIVTPSRRLFQFVAPKALAGEWKQGDRVRWEGYFYKVKLYPTRAGTENLTLVFVLTVLEKPPAPPAEGR